MGWRAASIRFDLWTIMPAAPRTRRPVGTVTWTVALDLSVSRYNSAADWWLSAAPGPHRSTAAQSTAVLFGSPVKVA